MPTETDDQLRQRAKRRVNQKMGFYIHLAVYVLVNLGLAAINLMSGGQRWHLWPLAGWGLGLAIHGIVTFTSLRGEGLRERMLDDEFARLKQRNDR
ncbi:MAG TPA: 2TM domain-containing protein [Rubrivivax sp.]|nr:2TM domain-containing protein [Rubrivivax sp.]